jgi:hypothetical protein
LSPKLTPFSVWARYSTQPLTINTQASYGNVVGQVSNNVLSYANGAITFPKPTARDIFGCSTGPFATGGNAQKNTIIPRLAAAFNRSTLLVACEHPNKVAPAQYYQNAVTNVSRSLWLSAYYEKVLTDVN